MPGITGVAWLAGRFVSVVVAVVVPAVCVVAPARNPGAVIGALVKRRPAAFVSWEGSVRVGTRFVTAEFVIAAGASVSAGGGFAGGLVAGGRAGGGTAGWATALTMSPA